MDFTFYSFRFEFVAVDPMHFPAGQPGNILRGAFGGIFRRIVCAPECPGFSGAAASACPVHQTCPYARIFEPTAAGRGPSGLRNSPRPFVFRAGHLDGADIAAGERFWFDLNLFDMLDSPLEYFLLAFAQLAREGLGAHRSRAELLLVSELNRDGLARPLYDVPGGVRSEAGPPIAIPLEEGPSEAAWLRVRFVTPAELKAGDGLVAQPEFGVLFARARDRVSTLAMLYGAGPLEIDFRAMGERAARVRMTRCDLQQVHAARRSSRTGQVHGIGGFTGVAEYQGEVGEFVPFLEAARWTGVGRQCVWGKGEVRVKWGV